MKLLIVEDEIKTGEYLKKGLTESGFDVDLAVNGLDALNQAMSEHYDLILLDIMLPKMDGWQVLQSLRNKNSQVPVIMLTARDKTEDRVKGLALGASDYLVKPFAFVELLARINNIFRIKNVTPIDEQSMTIANLKLDLKNHIAYRENEVIHLTSKEFSLLVFLMERRGEALSRSLIASQVWGMNFSSDTNVIDVAIRRLRNKVDKPFTPHLIHTIRGIGYVLDVDAPL